MATTTSNETSLRQRWINLIALLVGGGVVTAFLLTPVLLIGTQSPLLGAGWMVAGGLFGGLLGAVALSNFKSPGWARGLGTVALLLGVIAAAGAVGIVLQLPIINAGITALGALFFGVLSILPMTAGRARLGVILLAVAVGSLVVFSLAGPLWELLIFGVTTDALTWVFDPNRVDPATIVACYGPDGMGCPIVHSVTYSLIFFFVVLTGFAYLTLLERKFIAFFQQRTGPNRVGPWGLLQPAADGLKLIFKEDIIPSGADKPVYYLAPVLKAVPAIILLAVVPFGPTILIPWFDGFFYAVPLGLADVNVGVLWLLAITSVGTYGVVLAGWASNNKYAMLGGLRASAQMLSYELSLGLTMAVPILIVGSMSIGEIIRNQTMVWEWFIFQNPVAAIILFLALLAEISRSPFDLPEAEQELTQGFMTEYSGMKFAMFMMAEYLGMIGISAIFAALYMGGYNDGLGLVQQLPFLGPVVMIGKIILLLILMVWIRSTVPRIRYDRLMSFGWKIMLPVAIIAVMWTAVALLVGDTFESPLAYAVVSGIFFVVVMGFGALILRGNGAEELRETPLEDDPIITGENHGFGYYLLQALGALFAVPFWLFNVTIKLLDRLAKLAPDDKKPTAGDSKSIVKGGGD